MGFMDGRGSLQPVFRTPAQSWRGQGSLQLGGFAARFVGQARRRVVALGERLSN
jgi:hypothetical protein